MKPSSIRLYLWAGFLVLFPFYVLPSGLPQPADGVMALLILVTIPVLGIGVASELRPPIRAGFAFAAYTAVVTAFYAATLVGASSMMLLAPVYYFYNALVFAVCLTLHATFRDRFLRVTFISVAVSLGIEVILGLMRGIPEARGTVSFNNPNQLGYYALLAGTIVLLVARRTNVRVAFQALLLLGAIFLSVLSLSKAAMFGLALLLVLVFVRRPLVALVLIALLALAYAAVDPVELVEKVHHRIETRQPDETLAARGYDRLVNYPEYLVFGASEGQYGRLESQAGVREIHSAVGTLLFAYGVVGTALFAYFVLTVYRQSGTRGLVYLVPLFFYSLTHQGLRFTLFWVVLALIACTGRGRSRTPPTRVSSPASDLPAARGRPPDAVDAPD